MKFKIYNLHEKSKYLHMYLKYKSNETIIPIGSDCHSAYILNGLNLRNHSFVFDWLNTDSKLGIEYVNKNIETNFKYFLDNLVINYRGHVISQEYPYVEFFHEKNLINSESDRKKMIRRAERFMKYIKNTSVTFLYVINLKWFKNETDVIIFINSIKKLHEITNNKHKIKIFIKYNQDINESLLGEKIIEYGNKINNTKIVKYLLNTDEYGQWGNSKDYYPLFKKLDINIKKCLIPKIYIQ